MMKAPQPEVVATASRQNPGETLRQAREQKGLSLSQVAGQLNLTENSLRQLENGAFDKLPGHTFSRGYIRAPTPSSWASTRPSWSTASTISPAPMPAAAPYRAWDGSPSRCACRATCCVSSVCYCSPC